MAELFGFRFERAKEQGSEQTFTSPTPDDGTIDVAGGGFWVKYLTLMVVSEQTLTLFVDIETFPNNRKRTLRLRT